MSGVQRWDNLLGWKALARLGSPSGSRPPLAFSLLDGLLVQDDFRVFVGEVVHRPLAGEEDDGVVEFVGAEVDATGHDEIFRGVQQRMRLQPAELLEGSRHDSGFGFVFGFEARLHDFELEWSDGGEESCSGGGMAHVERLHDAFEEELLQTGAVFFGIGRNGVRQPSKYLGGEAGDFVVSDGAIFGESVANAEGIVTDETDHITRPCEVDGFPVLAEEFVGGR